MMPAPIQLEGPHVPSAVRRRRIALVVMAALFVAVPFAAAAIASYLGA